MKGKRPLCRMRHNGRNAEGAIMPNACTQMADLAPEG